MFRFLAVFLLVPSLVLAVEYKEPARGSDTRRQLMEAIRPHAIWNLGEAVEFVIEELRVADRVAFASLSPQRVGGAAIDFWQTPLAKRGEIDPEFYDGVWMHVLYEKSGSTWVAVHWSIGSTDVWWAALDYCVDYGEVIPEYCP